MAQAKRISCPFKVEPAKSGRSRCKGCSAMIEKGDLRLTVTTWLDKRGFSKNMHIGCFQRWLKAGLGCIEDHNEKHRIQYPKYIQGWEKLSSKQMQSVLKNIYKMRVSISDIENDDIPHTGLMTPKQKADYNHMLQSGPRVACVNIKDVLFARTEDEMQEVDLPDEIDSTEEILAVEDNDSSSNSESNNEKNKKAKGSTVIQKKRKIADNEIDDIKRPRKRRRYSKQS